MKRLILFLLLLSACSSPKSVSVPNLPECNQKTSDLTYGMFDRCIIEGMSYEQVAGILGWQGQLLASNKNVKTYQWQKGNGFMSATFIDNKLLTKAQAGL